MRTSIDCTIPDDSRLAYQGSNTQVAIPLALLAKRPMRDLDVRDDAGAHLLVLGASENAAIAVEMVLYALNFDGVVTQGDPLPDGLRTALEDIVRGPAEPTRLAGILPKVETSGVIGSHRAAERLLFEGFWAGRQVLTPDEVERVSPSTKAMLLDLAKNFLLVVVVPRDRVAERQVLKFAYYWHVDHRPHADVNEIASWRKVITGSFGFEAIGIQLPVGGIGDAASYHLEVHTPRELVSEGLVLPIWSRSTEGIFDETVTPVAHAHGSYPVRDDDDEDSVLGPSAWLSLGVTRRGTKSIALLMATFTFVFFLLGITLDGGLAQLRGEGNPDGAVDPSALLLTLPAVVVGLLVTNQEHSIASVLLLPIRAASILCSGLLVAAAASLTFQLRDPYLVALWNVSLAISGLLFFGIIAGEVVRARRSGVRGLN